MERPDHFSCPFEMVIQLLCTFQSFVEQNLSDAVGLLTSASASIFTNRRERGLEMSSIYQLLCNDSCPAKGRGYLDRR